jgi:sulfite exporter TauE/SafE
MIGLAATVLAASVVGSPHCAGMCGGIAAFCGGVGECGARRSLVASAIYHGSRLASYAAVGALAGAFGTLLDAGGALVGVQRVAAVAAGVAVAALGVALLARASGVEASRVPLPAWVRNALAAVHRAAAALPPARRALVIGLATPLLPCGWLWAFAAVAAGTGSVAGGALVMAAFWAGTVPVLAVVGAGVAGLGADRRRLLGALAGVAMIAVGIHTAGVRGPMAETIAERLAARADPAPAANAGAVRSACCETEPVRAACCDAATTRPACCESGAESEP